MTDHVHNIPPLDVEVLNGFVGTTAAPPNGSLDFPKLVKVLTLACVLILLTTFFQTVFMLVLYLDGQSSLSHIFECF